MGRQFWGYILCLWFVCTSGFGVVRGENLGQECQDDFQKVMKCVNYATGKEDTPSKDCCSAVQEVKESDAKCLCYIMQQTHSGGSQFRNLGIQEAKLLQLPSACQLQNATVSNCPKLLGLSPNSPDAAIFSNTSTTAPSSTTTTTGAAPEKSGKSGGNDRNHILVGPLLIAVAVLFYAFPAEYAVF
ncbi:hypothetical protein K2173_005914 [Erythroxylum novogranatense]|uniref:Bifunctional inhibitor/plant lipid transfer protein/seed storage helical domain-containing protein n=1 Tax=Erythroxylum novogranatense TaxID=1862640 RepID=A0AAV8U394_9ROSI|nr:hypothetical protein K2173_005914 [Erythroxylum novogranatense]